MFLLQIDSVEACQDDMAKYYTLKASIAAE